MGRRHPGRFATSGSQSRTAATGQEARARHDWDFSGACRYVAGMCESSDPSWQALLSLFLVQSPLLTNPCVTIPEHKGALVVFTCCMSLVRYQSFFVPMRTGTRAVKGCARSLSDCWIRSQAGMTAWECEKKLRKASLESCHSPIQGRCGGFP